MKRLTLDELLALLGKPPPANAAEVAVGSRVVKHWSNSGDRHRSGSMATVIERVPATGPPVGYVVVWDGEDVPCFVVARKLRGV